MLYVVIAVVIIALAVALMLWMIRPNTARRDAFSPFEQIFIAHRGLFNNGSDAPENSMSAFRKAVDAGYGIELDVQMTSDGELVVFHDWSMERLTEASYKITEHEYQEICRFGLAESDERVPLFSEVLKLVSGKVPLVIEIKVGFRFRDTTKMVAEMMQGYEGIYCIECFNPLALRWYRKKVPQVLRGQLAMNFYKDPIRLSAVSKFFLSNLMLNFLGRPDFISFHYKDTKQLGFAICRRLFKVKTAAWTIQSESDLNQAKFHFDVFIFESFLPSETQTKDS